MCGLSGYIYFNKERENSSCTIRKMLELQRHRGPDDSGIMAINTSVNSVEEIPVKEDRAFNKPANVVLGFNRLSILDLSPNGHQPMQGADGQVILLMNGEVYNAFDFRDDLIRQGYHFKSTTDTEVVLNLYLAYGFDKMIRLLNGMFAIVVLDLRTQKLFLARDRFGIKPLYIWKENGCMAFASEIKSFKALPGFQFKLDEQGLDEFLLFRNLINQTLFKDVENIEQGTYRSFDMDGKTATIKYYSINDEGQTQISSKDAFGFLEQSLHSSVKRQMISDVKLGCQLSGGVDSSLVTYYATKELEKGSLETISVIFDNPRYSEKKFIDIVAEKLQLQSHQYKLDAGYYFREMDKASWHFEQPLNHPNTIGIYLLSQEARKHVTVLLSGEGADEALAGYSRFIQAERSPYFSRYFISKLKQHNSELTDFIQYYKNADSRMVMSSAFGSLTVAKFLKKDFSLQGAIKRRVKILEGISGNGNTRQRKYELLTYLPDLLMRQDKMSMAHSIENRVPFLDNELIKTALQIPGDLLIGNHNGKKEAKLLLKKICSVKFDESFSFRDKMGFGIPLRAFMESAEFQKKWKEQLFPGIKSRKIFEACEVDKWVNNLSKASPEQLDAIWLMAGFEIWARQYISE